MCPTHLPRACSSTATYVSPSTMCAPHISQGNTGIEEKACPAALDAGGVGADVAAELSSVLVIF